MHEEPAESHEGFVRLGPTTRPVQLSSGEIIAFTREALEATVEQARTRFLPEFIEHLHYLPPVGRLAELRVVETQDEAYLVGFMRQFCRGTAGDSALPRQTITTRGRAEEFADLELLVSYEPRNFEPDKSAILEQDAPLPVGHHSLHADLPPLIWLLTFGAGAGATWASKCFVEAFMKRVGEALGNGLIDWLGRAARRAKQPDRANLVECRFETANGVQILAFCPFSPDSGSHVENLRKGIESLGDVALFCGSIERNEQPTEMRQAAFLWDGSRWQLSWWASDEDTFITDWYRRHYPDPKQFLGRPILTGLEVLKYMLDRDSSDSTNDTWDRGNNRSDQSI